MPKPQTVRNMALLALFLGVSFLGANLYLHSAGHPKLANLFFTLGILGNTAFALLAIFWSLLSSWVREPERPPMPMPGPAGKMPGLTLPPRPPQPPAA